MLPKTFSFLSLVLMLCVQSYASTSTNPPAEAVNAVRPNLKFDFENCVAYGGGSSADYSEFVAAASVNSQCTQLSVFGDHLYRLNPNRNSHSCAPGMNGTTAMCISAHDYCNYFAGHEQSLRINVMVEPGPDGVGNLDNIAFFSKAPRDFVFINGLSGANNYPTKFAIRILTDAGEIYRQDEIATAEDWAYRSFDLSSIPATTVTSPTLFRIEILPYCLAGIDSDVQAWDIEDLVITGGCNNVNGGTISTTSPTDLCSTGTENNVINATAEDTKGQQFSWIVTDSLNQIVTVQNNGFIGFNNLANGDLNIYHLAYEAPITGLAVGSFLFNLQGCYDLSNALTVNNKNTLGGDLVGLGGNRTFSICPNGNSTLTTILSGNRGDEVRYLLTAPNGTILAMYNNGTIDFSSLGQGDYNLTAISYAGPVSGLVNGNRITAITGCFALSSSISISRLEEVMGGTLATTAGQTEVSFCNNMTFVDIVSAGTVGANNNYIITNPQGRILSIQQQDRVDISGINETTFFIWNISYEDGISGLMIDGLVTGLAGCFDLSNSITVIRDTVSAGDISTNGFSTTSLCLKNGENQAVAVTASNQSGSEFSYVITDENRNILEVTSLDNQGNLDFDNASPGVCFIYAVVYNGSITGLSAGASLDALAGDCFDISEPIRVDRFEVESGTISGPAALDVCLNDASTASITFSVDNAIGNFSSWIVTDMDGTVLETLGDGNVDFSGAPPGICRVYHLSHASEPVLYGTSNNVNDIVLACFELSEPVEVTRKLTEGGTFTLANGTTSIMLLTGQGTMPTFGTDLASNVGDTVVYITYDLQGNILATQTATAFDFSTAPDGACSIVAVSYCGTLENAEVGNRIDQLSGCYSQSNEITVTKTSTTDPDTLVAGIILTSAGVMTAEVCIGNSSPNVVSIVFDQNPVGPESLLVITNDQGEILELTTETDIDLTNAGSGVCLVYSLVYEQDPLTGLSVGSNLSDLDGEFALSVPVVVTRNTVAGGTLLTSDSLTAVEVIVGDGVIDTIQLIADGAIGDSSLIIITDLNGVLTEIPTLPLTFEPQQAGACLVWNLSFAEGLAGLEVGAAVPNLDGCFALSNPVRVDKTEVVTPNVNGGNLITSDSLTVVDVCLDGTTTNFLVDFILNDVVGDTMTLLLTDAAGVVLDLGFDLPYDLGSVSAGTCSVWNIAWNGSLPDLEVGVAVDTLIGDFDLSNPVVFTKDIAIGGSLITPDSLTSVSIVVGDSVIDSIDVVLENAVGDTMVWVITDMDGNILELPVGPPFVFEGAGPGVCFIWNLSYATGLTGLEVGANVSGLDGCFSLSNSIQVTRTEPLILGGSLITVDSLTEVSLCLGVDEPEVNVLISGAVGEFMTYIVADTSGFIWGTFDNPSFQFNGANPGTCEIYHISYNGSIIGLQAGQDLDTLSGNFDLSNPILLDRNEVDGGDLMTTDSLTAVTVELGGMTPDSIDVILNDAIGANMAWVITDTLGNIVGLPANPPFVFEGAGAGVCQVWNLSFADGLTGLEVDENVADLDGCFLLSNPITVTRTEAMVAANGGAILTTDSLTTADICLASNTQVELLLDGAAGETMTYAVTDTTGLILALSSSAIIDFDGFPTGICEIVHLSYNGSLIGLEVDQDIDTLSGDFDLSNVITVTKEQALGGSLMTTDSLTELTIIVGDGTIDSIDVVLVNAAADTMSWVVTDTLGNILELPASPPFVFEGAGPGVCQIWNLSYSFGLTGLEVNENVSNLSGCFQLSNPVTVTREEFMTVANGGSIITTEGLLTADLCLSNANAEVDVVLSGASGESMTFAITDTTGVIIGLFSNPPFLFDGLSAGICEIVHLSYNGSISGLDVGQDIDTLAGDFSLSNTILVTRTDAEGGSLMTSDSLTELTIIVGDGIIDSIDVVLNNAVADTMSWVVTDTLGNILELPASPPFVLEGAGPGVCQIWNLSYATGLTGLEVDANVSSLEGCFDFSNPIVVTRELPPSNAIGGSLMTADSMTTTSVCLNGLNAQVAVILDGAVGDSSTYVVTNALGEILQLTSDTLFTFMGVAAADCDIWHLSYFGALDGLAVGENVDTLSGDFNFSNAVSVSKEFSEAGLAQFEDDSFTQTITVGDGMPDTLNVKVGGASGDSLLWALTDMSGNILELMAGTEFIFPDTTATGDCNIIHVSHADGITGLMVGNNINLDLNGCFDLSNLLIVTKEAVVNNTLIAGALMTADSMTVVDVCVGDNGATVDVLLSGQNGPSQTYVVTDTTGIILQLPVTEPISFPASMSSTCEILHLVYDSILTGLVVGEDLDTLSGNFLLSNAITVNKTRLDANTIALDNSMTSASIITADGVPDTLVVVPTAISADTSVYVLLDGAGVILSVQDSTSFIFNNEPTGTCFIREVSYNSGFTGLVGGVNIADLTGCYALSNEIAVTKTSAASVNGGVITTPIGTSVEVCLSNTVVDSVFVSLSNVAGDTTQWVVTDTFGIVLALPMAPPFAFDTLSAGACQIWHLSSTQPLTGLSVGVSVDSITSLHDFSNPINVDKNESFGGDLLTAAGMSFDTITLSQSPVEELAVSLTGNIGGENMTWVVTDTLGNIVDLNATPPFNFENSSTTHCNVWHLSYADGITGLQVGSNINTDLSGCYDFSDSIRVVKVTSSSNLVNGGVIAIAGGGTMYQACQGNAVEDSIDVVITGELGPNFSFVVMTASGFLLSAIDTTMMMRDTVRVPVDGLPADSVFLYHMAYQPGVATSPGQNLSNNPLLDLSNPIVIFNNNVAAGALVNTDTLSVIVGDGIADIVSVQGFGTVLGDEVHWVVYDSLGVITSIDLGPAPPQYDFESNDPNVYHIVRVASITGLTGFAVGGNINTLEGCYDITEPKVIVAELATLSGGTLLSVDSTTIVDYCFNSTYTIDTLEVILSDTIGENFAWVVTDTSGQILELPADSLFVFEDTDVATSFVWNLSFEGSLTGLMVGEDIDTLMGEFLLSNPITVNVDVVNGGTISTPSGETEFTFCVGDGDLDVVNFTLADTVGGNYQYVITDTLNSILFVPAAGATFQDFEGFGDGVCRVYNMSSSEEIIGLVPGMQLDSLAGCYELSNFLTINKNGVDGNIITSVPLAIDNVISFIVNDGISDTLTLSTQSTMGSYQYVITDENDEIDSLLVGNGINFEGFDFGECKIYGISYTGNFIGMPGDTVGIQAMSSECEDITNLPITVFKEDGSNLIITEVIGSNQVELLNNGTAPINTADLFLHGDDSGEFSQISDLSLVCGASYVLQPNEYLVLDLGTAITVDPADGQMALYSSPQFGSFNAIRHYVEWGSTGHLWSSIAVGAQLWSTGEFAVPFTATTALKYDGVGFVALDWSEGTSTACASNITTGNTIDRLTYETYPNPAQGELTILIKTMSEEDGMLLIYDSYGSIVDRRQVKQRVEHKIDLSAYGSGLYYTKVVSGREGVVKKLMIVK